MANGPQHDEMTVAVPEREPPQVIEEGPSLPVVLTADFLKEFEKGVEVYKRWVALCYRLTRPSHWLNHGSEAQPRFALQGPGAEALMNPLGLNFDRPSIRKEDLGDGQYAFWAEGYVESKTLGRRGWYVGYCDSKDQFFNARPGWTPRTGQGDVMKSAVTNWLVNAVTRIAGIRDPEPAILVAAGLDLKAIPRVDYGRSRTPEADATVISEAQRKRLWAIKAQMGITDATLKRYLAETHRLESTATIPRGKYDQIVQWIQAEAKAAQERWAQETGPANTGPIGAA